LTHSGATLSSVGSGSDTAWIVARDFSIGLPLMDSS
jgi:hypothetical protein